MDIKDLEAAVEEFDGLYLEAVYGPEDNVGEGLEIRGDIDKSYFYGLNSRALYSVVERSTRTGRAVKLEEVQRIEGDIDELVERMYEKISI
jgi:hypothetical protein